MCHHALKRRWWGERAAPVPTPAPAPTPVPVTPTTLPDAPFKRERRFPRTVPDPRHPDRWPATDPVVKPIGRPVAVKLVESIEGDPVESWT